MQNQMKHQFTKVCANTNDAESRCRHLLQENFCLKASLMCLRCELNDAKFGASMIELDDKKTCFYTGLSHYKVL